MNDFTEYELQSLLWAIGYVRERTNNCGDTMRYLKTKIRSMIDNYCNHENDGKEYVKSGSGRIFWNEGTNPFNIKKQSIEKKCTKCDVYYKN